jgi:prefoldin subunit 5
MGPSPRLLRAVDAERATLERQRAQLAREAATLRASLARIEAGLAEIDALCARLDGLVPHGEGGPGAAAAGATRRGLGGEGAAAAGAAGEPRRGAGAANEARRGATARGAAGATDPHVLRGPAIRTTAVAVLVASGRDALHYRAWFDLLTQAGYDVVGKDPLAVFLTQISRSPAVRKGARPGEYVLDRTARATLQQRLHDLNRELATLPQRTSDLTELRTTRQQLTHEITKTEKALEELLPAA